MPDSPITRNLQDGVLYIQDGDDPVNSLEVTLDSGDLAVEWGVDDILTDDRGVMDHFRPAKQEPIKVSFTAKQTKIAADDTSKGGTDTAPTPDQALDQEGLAAGWVSTGKTGESYLVTLVFKIANPDSAGRREVITIPYFRRGPVKFAEGEENNTLDFSGLSRAAKPTFSWEAQT